MRTRTLSYGGRAGLILLAGMVSLAFAAAVLIERGTASAEADNGETVSAAQSNELTIYPRWDQFGWRAPTMDIMDALEGNQSADGDLSDVVTAVFRWDGSEQRWESFFPDAADVPGAVNFTEFEQFSQSPYVVAITGSDPITFIPPEN